MNWVLLAVILVPLLAGLALLLVRWPASFVRQFSLAAAFGTLVLSIILAVQYHEVTARYHAAAAQGDQAARLGSSGDAPVRPGIEFRHEWLTLHHHSADRLAPPTIHLEFYLGMDGVSLCLVLLSSLLTISAILISWDAIEDRVCGYYAGLLILEGGLHGAFCAFDIVLFYVFFEFTLLPLFFLVGIWGGPRRHLAAVKFFLYTFAGSIVTLSGIVLLMTKMFGTISYPFSIPAIASALADRPLPITLQIGIFLALSVGFAVKVPLFPFHTWLPLAHVEAPTAGSVLLAGVLLKLGAYGFLRLCLPILPDACATIGTPLIGTLAVIGIIYGSLCAYAQSDLKKIVAYSSISHLGFCMLGMFALNLEGLTGSFLQFINHGLSTGALFLLVGMVYERYHTREVDDLGGLASRLPLISAAMVFTCLASAGLPGLNGFVGEFLSLVGMFKTNAIYASVATLGVILAALYLLTMLLKAFFGPVGPVPGRSKGIPDLLGREAWAVVPLMVLCLAIGVYPKPLIDTVEPDIKALARLYDGRREHGTVGPIARMEDRP